uniref:Retrovirus-related Pol polyprotein from transposon TNT 1-94 n=1 Tax=Tanacetum cinerariifolium TaxID=118510 RepID=A0A6L2N539_TANCI|nr:retrovirus-related Pol polyprotein from transposon TNT 1-94 [Tanacetum cinerariifolium]
MGYLKFSAKDTKREVFGMPIPGSLITADIQEALYYQEYLANVTKHRRFLAGQTRSAQDSHASKPAKPARKPKLTTQKDRINILQYLINLRMCKDYPTKMMKMFLLVENLRQQNPNNYEVAACSSLRSLKSKRTIKSRAKRSSKNNLSRTSFQYAYFFTHCENALSALRRSSLRTGSTAVKPCQGYSLEFYLITGSIHTDQRGTVVLVTLFNGTTKDETSGILKSFITRIENLVDHKVKMIRCDNETEFKNREMNQFCKMKGILRQFSVARTPQQNRVAERRNRTLIEAARTMLADSKLPTTFWAEAVNTACYVQNRVLVVKPYNKTPYEIFHGKFDNKADEGFFVRYSLNSKAFRVFNSRTRIVEDNLHIRFSIQSNDYAGTKASDNVSQARKEIEPVKDYILLQLWTIDLQFSQDPKSFHDDGFKPSNNDGKKVDEDPRKENECKDQEKEDNVNSTNDVIYALKDTSWIEAIHEELLQFKLQKVWTLVDLSNEKRVIGTKWGFRNKKDERGIVIRNKARLFAQGHTKEEGIDYDEVFALVARIKAIRLFLAYVLFQDFVVYQMDVKSNFLHRKIEEEVYVCQPLGFEDLDFSDRVYKVEKALYELHQAPRAWYKGDILLVQVYVDDIIFGSTRKELCNAFERNCNEKKLIQMVKFHTDKNVADLLTKAFDNNYGLLLWPIPSMGKHKYMPGDGKKVIISEASIRRDLQFADEKGAYCLPNSIIIEQLALMSMGRNLDNFFRKFVMYPTFIQVILDNQINGISNHERKYVSSSHTKKVFGNMRRIGKGFSGRITPLFPTMMVQSQLGEGSAMPTDPHHIPTILQPSSLQPQKTHKPTKHKRKDTQVPHLSGPIKSVIDEAVYKELDDSLVRAATNASSLKAEQDNGNISNILQSDEDRLKLNELMELCTNLQTRVLDLEKTKTILSNKINSLNRRVKKQRRSKSRTHKLKRLYNVSLTARVESLGYEQSLGEDTSKYGRRIDDIDGDEYITLVSVHDDADKEMFDADKDLGGEEVFVEQEVADKEKIDEVTLAQALAEIKTSKPKVKRVVIQEPRKSTTTTTTFSSKQKSQDKGKAKMVEEHVKPKKKEQIRLDEVALKLQAEFVEEEILIRESSKRTRS